MLDDKQCSEAKTVLEDFSLARPCMPAAEMPACLHNYLEFYGFFETLKGIEVDYFWGYRCCAPGARIATHFWRLPNAKGNVLLVHGLFDHVGLFLPLIRHFLNQGYSVIALDLPGHGLSDGEVTVINSFEQYGEILLDTAQFFAPQTQTLPLYGVGQSTGAAALMALEFDLYKKQLPSVFERLVFLGPLVRPRQWGIARWIYRLLGRRLRYVARDFSNANTHDAEFHHFLKSFDPLQPRRLSTQWVGALNQWVDGFASQPVVETPLLVVQGTADKVVDWQLNIPAIKEHFSCVQVNMIEGAKHHLANEADPWRKAIYGSVGQFFRQRVVCVLPS